MMELDNKIASLEAAIESDDAAIEKLKEHKKSLVVAIKKLKKTQKTIEEIYTEIV